MYTKQYRMFEIDENANIFYRGMTIDEETAICWEQSGKTRYFTYVYLKIDALAKETLKKVEPHE